MSRYEVLMLVVPEVTQDESAGLESQFQHVVKRVGASLVSFERWGKYKLAYPVNKNDYGVYFLARFEIEAQQTAALDQVRSFLAVDQRNIVMRSLVSTLDAKSSLEYRRPPSLEETPAKESPSFGRSRQEGKGQRSGFGRGPRGNRAEGGYSRRTEHYRAPEQDSELDLMNDGMSEEQQ